MRWDAELFAWLACVAIVGLGLLLRGVIRLVCRKRLEA